MKLVLPTALSAYNIDIQLPSRLHNLLITNCPIPDAVAARSDALNDNVCPALIAGVSILLDNTIHSPLPSMQYSQTFGKKRAVRPSSKATIVR